MYGRVFYLNFSWVNSFVYSSMQKQILNTELQTIVLCILKHLLDFLIFFLSVSGLSRGQFHCHAVGN